MHEANIALDEPPRAQQHRTHIFGGVVVETVERFGRVGLFGEVHGFGRRRLHAIGEIIGTRARRQFAVVGARRGIDAVQLLERSRLSRC